jgi:hypothetical protein
MDNISKKCRFRNYLFLFLRCLIIPLPLHLSSHSSSSSSSYVVFSFIFLFPLFPLFSTYPSSSLLLSLYSTLILPLPLLFSFLSLSSSSLLPLLLSLFSSPSSPYSSSSLPLLPPLSPFFFPLFPNFQNLCLKRLIPRTSHLFIRVSLAQVARNLSAKNSRENTARKTISKPTSNTCCFSATHTRVHSSGLKTWLFSFPSLIRSNFAPSCSKILPPWLHQLQALFLALSSLPMHKLD